MKRARKKRTRKKDRQKNKIKPKGRNRKITKLKKRKINEPSAPLTVTEFFFLTNRRSYREVR